MPEKGPTGSAVSGRLLALLLAASVAMPAAAQAPAPAPKSPTEAGAAAPIDAHRRDDIAKHRVIAAAHAAAASCLEAGRKESDCQAALRKACEGIAVGRYCGMKHSH
ncbi:MAG: hypothetical protein EHM87_08875 [Burkholderiales bacterium]|nr:MAG: hypothetical protein EHM87_08875 [Burkholderiales bacterium]